VGGRAQEVAISLYVYWPTNQVPQYVATQSHYPNPPTISISLSTQSSTFCQCFTLSSVLTLYSSLALTLTSPTVFLIMFSLLSHLSSLILSSVLSFCCLNTLAFTSDRVSGISHGRGLGGGRNRKQSKAVDNHTGHAQQHTLGRREIETVFYFF
jgi:hypothetical protein